MDEMNIKQQLVYDKHSGVLIYFTDLGSSTNFLLELERSVDGNSSTQSPQLAKFNVDVHGTKLCVRLRFQYGQFLCMKCTLW